VGRIASARRAGRIAAARRAGRIKGKRARAMAFARALR
jgi:hypothetical protein